MGLGVYANGTLNPSFFAESSTLPSEFQKRPYLGYVVGISISDREAKKVSLVGQISIMQIGYAWSYQNDYLPNGKITSQKTSRGSYSFLNTQLLTQIDLNFRGSTKRKSYLFVGVGWVKSTRDKNLNGATISWSKNIDRLSADTTFITLKTLDKDIRQWNIGIPIQFERQLWKTRTLQLNLNFSVLINLKPTIKSSINIQQGTDLNPQKRIYTNGLKNSGSYCGIGLRLSKL